MSSTNKSAFRPAWRAVATAAALLATAAMLPAQAQANLTFSANAQVWGSLNTQYSSPLMGNVSFQLNGTSDYKYNQTGSSAITTGVASATYAVPADVLTSDPIYNIVTQNGEYGFSYTGQSEVTGLALRTQIESSTVNRAGDKVDSAYDPISGNYTSQNSWAYASWNNQFYIAGTPSHANGTYGAIVVGITLDGDFPSIDPTVYNGASAQLNASSSFIDAAGVSYSSQFGVYASNGSWSGSQTVYKKLLFQYGTVFSVNMYQYAISGNNGMADFFHTGQISHIELPYQATLITGAGQDGLGTNEELFGAVINSTTADAENTNWDFGNNGGGFTPNVPEPQTYALMLAGLATLGALTRRRRAG